MLKSVKNIDSLVFCLLLAITLVSCQDSSDDVPDIPTPEEEEDINLPDINLSNWKVTLPIGNPTEVLPPEILNYAKNETLKSFMYNDSIEGALVFYTYPGASTAILLIQELS